MSPNLSHKGLQYLFRIKYCINVPPNYQKFAMYLFGLAKNITQMPLIDFQKDKNTPKIQGKKKKWVE
jgi:hypothetical protein